MQKFLGDIGKVNSGIASIAPQGTLLQRVFSGMGEAVSSFGREILNVAEYALGKLLADSITFIVQKIRELVMSTIEAGQEFQTLSLRLDRLNFNEIRNDTDSFATSMAKATEMTKGQLNWLQLLAAQTPYDNQDIANVYTLARSYGFAAKESQGLTQDIINFSSGMGLSNQEMERIIVNFGQMVQQGKVTGREMTDLARGAFVPVNDVLEQMKKNTGLAGQEFEDFRGTAEGVQAFMKAFSDVVATEFAGAAEKMARSFKGATGNALDMVKSIAGLNIITPILDAVGGKIADFLSKFTKGQQELEYFQLAAGDTSRWEQLVAAATRIGTTFQNVFGRIIGHIFPDMNSGADGVVSAVERIADWIEDNRVGIILFFTGIADTIKENVVPFVKDLVESFKTVSTWVDDNSETINEFFSTLGEIVSQVLEDLFGVEPSKSDGLTGFLETLSKVMEFVIDHKEEITKAVEGIIIGFVAFQIAATVLGFFLGILLSILGFVGSIALFVVSIVGLISAFSILGPILTAIGTLIISVIIPAIAVLISFLFLVVLPIMILVGVIALLYWAFSTNFLGITDLVTDFWTNLKAFFGKLALLVAIWAVKTALDISEWATKTWESITTWVSDTLASISEWTADDSILQWANKAVASIATWASDTKTKITNWVTNVGGSISKWAGDALSKFRQFSTDAVVAIASWINNSLSQFASWASRAYATLSDSVASIDWFSIGASIITSIIRGFTSKALPALSAPPITGGGGGGGGCFIAGTKVLMADGTQKNIEDVGVGETVRSYDTDKKNFVEAKVTHALHHHERPQPYYLVVNNFLRVTPNHPLFVNGKWKDAGYLEPGDLLLNSKEKFFMVENIHRVDECLVVYNLHTDHEVHNYFADGVLAHNAVSKAVGPRPAGGLMGSSPVSSVPATSIVNSSVVINNEYNLSIHSSANTEPIVQDFAMMQSMSGGG